MKIITYILIIFAVTIASLSAELEGLWGGKWDDTWPVFIQIKKSSKNRYKIKYSWIENNKDRKFSTKILEATKVENYFSAEYLFFKMNEDKLLLYGDFEKPRMANLVKIKSSMPTSSKVQESLAKNGWEPGAIPAEDALKEIQENSLVENESKP